jgi:adenylate cyclase
MEPAPELVTFFNKFMGMWSASDIESGLDAFSRHEGALALGSDPDEWWDDYKALQALVTLQWQQFRDLGGFNFATERISAWKEGSVGWIAARGRITVGTLDPVSSTCTLVVHEEGAHWRCVQFHLAIDVPNEDVLGVEMATSVDDLLVLVKDELPPAGGMAPDGSVTIMFTDLEGSTSLMESLGERRWLELLERHNSLVTSQVAAFGGTVVKGEGDGFMLAFPACGSATACAVAIQRAARAGLDGVAVPIRIGLHAGDAKAASGDFFGRTVVVAARITNAAKGGEILASDAVQEGLAGAFTLDGARSLKLKGFEADFIAFPVLWE